MANRFTGGATLQFGVEVEGFNRLVQFTNPKLWDKAQANGLRAAGRTARTQIPKGIGERYTIPSRRIKEDISQPYLRGDNLELRLSRKPPTANQYRFKPGRRGGPQPGLGTGRGWGKPSPAGRPATMQVFKGRPASPLPGAFLAPNGLPMLRVRRSRGRGSLDVLHGPSVGQIFTGRSAFAQELQSDAEQAIGISYIKSFEKTLSDAARGFGG